MTYQQAARAIAGEKRGSHPSNPPRMIKWLDGCETTRCNLAHKLADLFADDPQFDKQQFLAACEVERQRSLT